jgi:hypothetical protein
MPSVFMLSVTNNTIMLIVIMLSVVKLNVIMLNVVVLRNKLNSFSLLFQFRLIDILPHMDVKAKFSQRSSL